MSIASVKAAITPLLIAGINPWSGATVTVRDRNQQETLIPPITQMPLVLLRDRAFAEAPLAVGFADRPWWLEMTLWNVYAIDADQSDFDSLREQLAAVARSNTLLGGTAGDSFGTTSTQVYVSGRQIQQRPYPAIPNGAGQVLRHCTVSTLIREAVSFVGVV